MSLRFYIGVEKCSFTLKHSNVDEYLRLKYDFERNPNVFPFFLYQYVQGVRKFSSMLGSYIITVHRLDNCDFEGNLNYEAWWYDGENAMVRCHG